MSLETGPRPQEPKEYVFNTPVDAIHVISYEVEGVGAERRPNREGMWSIDATVALLQQGLSTNVIFSNVHYKTENPAEPRMSALYAQVLRGKLEEKGITGINVIAEAEELPPDKIEKGGKDTAGDVEFLLRQVQAHDWHKVLVVGHRPHLRRVQWLLEGRRIFGGRGFHRESQTRLTNRKRGIEVITRSSQAILKQTDPTFSLSSEDIEDNIRFRKNERKAYKYYIPDMILLQKKGTGTSFLAHYILSQESKAKRQS